MIGGNEWISGSGSSAGSGAAGSTDMTIAEILIALCEVALVAAIDDLAIQPRGAMDFEHPGEIVGGVRRVHTEEELSLANSGEHHVVHHAAALVQEHAVTDASHLHAGDVVREQELRQRGCLRARQTNLAHVGDVEESRSRPDRAVLLDDGAVHDGHLEAGKRGHLCARLSVSSKQRGARETFAH